MRPFWLFAAAICVLQGFQGSPALAQDPAAVSVSRRDGFLLLWQAIQRPAYATRETPFLDVQSGDRGFLEITYAKNRGVIDDDEERFRPDDPLTIEDALLWLYRTRNVAELPDMEREDLPVLMERYPIVLLPQETSGSRLTDALTEGELLALMRDLGQRLLSEIHEVSLYGEDFHGDGTAFGETFDMHALTAAHRSFPHNTLVRVTNIENETSVTVRINDRGPYVEGRDMDLSLAAFTSIAERSRGVIRARFERLGDVALVQGCGGELRFQKRIARDVRFHRGIPHRWKLGEQLTLQANRWFVVRSVTYPDGLRVRMQNWVSPDEMFTFTPSVTGEYIFGFSTAEGRPRTMRMEVVTCADQ